MILSKKETLVKEGLSKIEIVFDLAFICQMVVWAGF